MTGPRAAGHAVVLLLAASVTATTTVTPVRRAVDHALDSISFEDYSIGEAPFARSGSEDAPTPEFSPPSAEILELLRPRQSVVAHVVQSGDTVTMLAQRYNVTPQTIVWANNIADADRLPVGHALLILPMSGVLHTVKAGESVQAVADKYGIEARAIADANGLSLDKQLPPAEQIVIPGGRPLEQPRPDVSTRAIVRPDPIEPRPAPGAPARVEPAPPKVEPPKALKPSTYEVADGDSIVSIARRFGVSTGTIAAANGLGGDAADAIVVGQRLIVPPVDGVLHKVADGETIRGVAEHYGADTLAVIKINAIPEPYVVVPGQELVIPGGRVPDPEPTPVPPTPIPSVSYKVQPGDSVVSIADRFGVEPRAIARFNGLDQADLIAPGQTLQVPGGRERPAPPAGAAQPRSAPAPAPPAAAPARAPAQNPVQAVASLVRPIVRAAPAPAPAPAAAPAPPPRPVVSTNNWSVIEVASKFLGYAYVWGGHSPRVGFDCTGFTWYVYGQLGKQLPNHDLWGQMQSGPRIGRDSLQPGDLVFFANTYMPGLSHVGIYMGGGRFIHAGSERTGVTVTALSDPYWAPRYYGASRPW